MARINAAIEVRLLASAVTTPSGVRNHATCEIVSGKDRALYGVVVVYANRPGQQGATSRTV